MRTREMLGALAERPFRLLWLGRTTSSLGDALIPVALAFAVLEEGGAGDLGIVLAAYTLGRVAFILAGGVWADRLPRRLVMLAADGVRAAAQGTLALLLLAGTAETWHFAVASFCSGSAAAFFGPASTGLVPETVSRGRLQQANALFGVSGSGAEIVGPALSGVLVAAVGPGWVFALDAVSFAASAGFLAALRVGSTGTVAARQSFVADLVHGWREVTARTWVWCAFVTFSIGNTAMAAIFVLGPVVAERELGGAAAWGLILTTGAIGGTLGSVVALVFRPRRPLLVSFPVIALVGVWIATFIGPLPLVAIAVANALSWGAVAVANPLWDTVLQQEIPRGSISRVSSYDYLISFVFMPIGFTLAGPAADTFGLDTTLAVMAGMVIVPNFLILAVPSVRAIRRVDVLEEEAAAPSPLSA